MCKADFRAQQRRARNRRTGKRSRHQRATPTNVYRAQDRYLPAYAPKVRSVVRIDGGFVLLGGWLTRYEPKADHRREVLEGARKFAKGNPTPGPNRRTRRAWRAVR